MPNVFGQNIYQIVQTPQNVMLFSELVHDARIIRINGKHPPAHVQNWLGDSIGRWEGDTLVVDTTNFTAKTHFKGSSERLPSSSGSRDGSEHDSCGSRSTIRDIGDVVDRRDGVQDDWTIGCSSSPVTKPTTR